MKKRVFIGLPVTKDIIEAIQIIHRKYLYLPFRWLAPEYLHITVIEPWLVDSADPVIDLLQNVTAPAFSLKFTEVSFGPSKGLPRLFWVKAQLHPNFITLKLLLELKLGFSPDSRRLLPHLTLARFATEEKGKQRKIQLDNISHIISRKVQIPVSWILQVNSFCLYESQPFPTGKEYVELTKVPLGS